jgi:hypothetical protein
MKTEEAGWNPPPAFTNTGHCASLEPPPEKPVNVPEKPVEALRSELIFVACAYLDACAARVVEQG